MTVNVRKPRQIAYADQVCNPNMIINWNFQNIINQRGQTEYLESNTWDAIFDCWRKTPGSRISLNYENGIYSVEKIEITTSYHGLLCDFEADTFLIGEYYTLTLEVVNLIGTIILNFEGLGDGNVIKEGVNVFTLRREGEGSGRIFIYGLEGSSFKPIGIKVERGIISTYKNKVFNYAETLQKCQYYLERLGNIVSESLTPWVYVPNGQTYALLSVYYTRKRIAPSIIFNDGAYRLLVINAQTGDVSTGVADFRIAIDELPTENMVNIKVTFSALGVDAYVKLQRLDGKDNAFMLVSAEL